MQTLIYEGFMRQRCFVAALIGILATMLCYGHLASNQIMAGDLTWSLRGADLLLAGQNPYQVSLAPLPYSRHDPLWYPLPAVLIAIPFTLLPDMWAGALFFGCSSALLAFAVTKQGWWRLVIFLSAPFYLASTLAQWSPLITAAVLIPVLYPFMLTKPSLGFAMILAWPRRLGIVLCALVLLLTLAILPTWPLDWLHNIGVARHRAPITAFVGPLLLLAVVAWRRPEGRLLLSLALVPQLRAGYDSLPIWLVPQTFRASLIISLVSWLGMFTVSLVQHTPWLLDGWFVGWYYLPALCVLLQPMSFDGGGYGSRARVMTRPRVASSVLRVRLNNSLLVWVLWVGRTQTHVPA